MRNTLSIGILLASLGTYCATASKPLLAAAPTAVQALKLAPVQKKVEYDAPPAANIAQCTIKAEKSAGQTGWVVRDGGGQVLRMFLDTNKDNTVDLWAYYRDGIEVYRDVDADFDGKADQYRWLNTAGSRWAVDESEDGQIDFWKAISAEETTAELVAALADRDSARFARLLLTSDELAGLGLGLEKTKELTTLLKTAAEEFQKLASQQKRVDSQTTWLHFGGTRPGVYPAGTEGSTKDVVVYENVLAMFQSGGKTGQIQVGTLIQVGNVWRLIGPPQVPETDAEEMPLAGFFFRAPPSAAPDTAATAGAPSAKTQTLLEELQKLDAAADKAVTPAEQSDYNARRADLLQQLAADASTPADRAQWIRQLADTVSAAVQSGRYPDGVKRLADLLSTLSADAATRELAAYVRFRHLTAEYGVAIQAPKVNFQDVQTKWLESLEQYIKDYPESPDTADAMLQLAIAQEFAGEEDEAKKWYGQIVARFPDSEPAKKAAGAKLRLESVGRMIALRGTTVTGGKFDLQRDFKGKVVLLHYWATWCEPAVNDLDQLKELQAKYGKLGFTPVGVSLDGNKEELADFLKKNRLNWPQVYEPGSLDSRLAQELGILTLPTMILIDKSGKVISRNISIAEIEPELKRQLR